MSKYLLPLLVACSPVPEECEPELERVEIACENANVIGRHENTELHAAVDDLKQCAGDRIRVICSDPGLFEGKVLNITRKP